LSVFMPSLKYSYFLIKARIAIASVNKARLIVTGVSLIVTGVCTHHSS